MQIFDILVCILLPWRLLLLLLLPLLLHQHQLVAFAVAVARAAAAATEMLQFCCVVAVGVGNVLRHFCCVECALAEITAGVLRYANIRIHIK